MPELTTLEYAAIHIMAGLAASPVHELPDVGPGQSQPLVAAMVAVDWAQELLAELERRRPIRARKEAANAST